MKKIEYELKLIINFNNEKMETRVKEDFNKSLNELINLFVKTFPNNIGILTIGPKIKL